MQTDQSAQCFLKAVTGSQTILNAPILISMTHSIYFFYMQ